MATRRTQGVACLAIIASLAVSACSQTTRLKLLNFFFDGVPTPGATAEDRTAAQDTQVLEQEEETQERPALVVMHPHPPYRDNRCGACHDVTTGGLFRTPQEGLCQDCHKNIPGNVRYVHGPVAVSDCLFCHHPHTSSLANLLLVEPTSTCLRCHAHDDLMQGTHHERMEEESCTSCHDAHGGDHQFFLKRVGK